MNNGNWIIVERKPGNVLTLLVRKGADTTEQNEIISSLPDDAAPGSQCYTADMTYIANKDLDGTWTKIGG